jgi:F-type H+-transporting ATPase subunit a
MRISPDTLVFFRWGPILINATIVFTWIVMALMVLGSKLVTHKLTSETQMSRWQNLMEVLVTGIRDQIRDISHQDAGQYLPFVGTLFLFIGVCNILSIVPGFDPPTGSLSTTAALATCVFVAVPLYGIAHQGLSYFTQYIKPSVFMLPFNVMGELSRTLALAVRLFGNVMSGSMIAGILLAIAPLVFPIVMQALGLLTGLIQAYIFAILAMVYIAAATRIQEDRKTEQQTEKGEVSDG